MKVDAPGRTVYGVVTDGFAYSDLVTPIHAVIGADFDDPFNARDVERTVADIEARIAELFPVVTRVYIRPVGSSGADV